MSSLIKTFKELSKTDSNIAGGKGASLGEMTQAKIPIPQGFVVTSEAFDKFSASLETEIKQTFAKLDPSNPKSIEQASKKIQTLILSQEISKELEDEVLKSYKTLNSKFVAVRSSATAEDSDSTTWAGQLDTYLNTTQENLLENMKKCWASLFTPRAIFYRFEHKQQKDKISVAVVVQEMIDSENSGVAFSVNPVTQSLNQIVIEAGLGLGEAIVSGSITPDNYVVEKESLEISNIILNEQKKALYRKNGGGNEWKNIKKSPDHQVLNNKEIIELSKLIIKIENHYKFPVDIEWAQNNNKFYITQARPITTLETQDDKSDSETMIDMFLQKTKPEEVFSLSFEFIPIFWTNPIFLLDKNLKSSFAPTLLIKNEESSHLFIDSNYVFGAAKEILTNFVTSKHDLISEISKRYETTIKNINTFYEKSLKEDSTEKDLLESIKNYNQIFNDFLSSTSLTYLDHEAVAEAIKKDPKIGSDKIQKILEVDTHKSFELINETSILNFKKSNDKNTKSLAYLFSSYSKIPTETDISKQLKKTEIPTLKESIREKEERLESNLKKYNKLYDQLNDQEKRLTEFIQLIKHIREDRKQYFSKLFAGIFSVSKFLLKKWDLHNDVENGNVFLFELLKGKDYVVKIKNDIKKRKQGYVLYCNQVKEPSLKPFSGDPGPCLKNLKDTISKMDSKFIKGQPAYKGKVTGKVVIAIKNKDFSKITENTILVTSMTRPEILPYLNKVKAIVTDEGGVTCHAAIISRELKKPCIIGTKTATHFLNDGDLVEVDANSGHVILLENKIVDFHHFKGENLSRSEKIQRTVVEMVINSDIPNEKRESSDIWELKHSCGCCQVGRILAEKRGLNIELVEIIAVLHDVAVITTGSYKDHARKGAVVVKEMLEKSNDFLASEIETICQAIAHHSEKEIYTDDPYIEIAKDLDAFDCCLYQGSIGYYKIHKPKEIFEKYCDRIRAVRIELGLQSEFLFRE